MDSEALKRWLAPLRQRIMLLLGRALLSTITESEGRRTAQATLLAGEVAEGLEMFEHFGFTSRPLADCEAVVMFQGGDRSFGMVVATDDPRYRPLGLEPGEVALYSMGDVLAEEESIPEVPDAPEGWPTMPATEDGLPPPLCRIQLLPDRTVRIIGGKLQFYGLEGISLAAPQILWGPPGLQTELPPTAEGQGRFARVGDCVDVPIEGTVYKGVIVESCD